MNIGLLNIMHTKKWDFRPDLAQTFAEALKNAVELHVPNDIEKKHGFFLSKKGYQKDGKTLGANFEDKLYVGNIYRVENHLYYNDEELAEDDQIVNVVVVDGPVTRDGDACSYGTKDFRDQLMETLDQMMTLEPDPDDDEEEYYEWEDRINVLHDMIDAIDDILAE